MGILFDDLHKKPHNEIKDLAVSPLSFWDDDAWRFAANTPGHRSVKMNWDIELDGGESLVHPKWENLLDDVKRLYFSVLYHNKRKPLRPLSLNGFNSALKYILFWMSCPESECPSFSAFTPAKADQFVKDLVEDKGGRVIEEAMTTTTIAHYVNTLIRIYEQGSTVREYPTAVIPEHPFNGRSAFHIAKKHIRKETNRIAPVPEDLFLPVVTAATKWLQNPADEVISAVLEYSSRAMFDVKGTGEIEAGLDRPNSPFTDPNTQPAAFPRMNGFRWEWHQTPVKRRLIDQRPSARLRELMSDVTGACLIVLQGLVGMRVNELCSLRAWPRQKNGLPYCVDVRPSLSGLEEIFYIRGILSKTQDEPTEVEWVAGSRPMGSRAVPLPITAILTLQALYLPWTGPGSPDLIKSIGRSPPDSSPPPMTIKGVTILQNRFIRNYVDVRPEYKNYSISTHQWRKSFALHIIRSDERLLAALSNHFKHLSIVMTEQAYVGSDIKLLALIRDTLVRDAVEMLQGVVFGKQRHAGKMAEIIEANMERIKAVLPKGPPEAITRELTHMLEDEDIRMFGAEWGGCFFRAETARCHHEVNGKFDLSARRPCYHSRRADLCCSCSNLLISVKHLDFWKKRHADNVSAYKAHVTAGNAVVAKVAKARADNSADVLRRISKLAVSEGPPDAALH